MKDIRLYKADASFVPNALKHSLDPVRENSAEIMIDAINSADHAWVATVDGEVACIWGLQYQNPVLGHVYLWLFMTDVAGRNCLRFTRKSKEFIDSLSRQYQFINGHLDPRREESRRWLEWLGFTFGEVQPPYGAVFWKGER